MPSLGPDKEANREQDDDVDEYPEGFRGKLQGLLYLSGNKCLKMSPRVRQYVEDSAPASLKQMKRGVESMFCLILMFQFVLMAIFISSFVSSLEGSYRMRYLSMTKNDAEAFGKPQCVAVNIEITDEFTLDDNGYWSTSSKWAFASSMLGVRARGFTTTENAWRKGGSELLYSKFRKWNSELANLGSSAAIVAMAMSDERVQFEGSKGDAFFTQIVADPEMLMKADYYLTFGESKNENRTLFDYTDAGAYAVITAAFTDWKKSYPKWRVSTNDGQDPETLSLHLNKYSVYVASAVNMGLISVSDLTRLDDSGASLVDDDSFAGDDYISNDDDGSYYYDSGGYAGYYYYNDDNFADDYWDDDDAFTYDWDDDDAFSYDYLASGRRKLRGRRAEGTRSTHVKFSTTGDKAIVIKAVNNGPQSKERGRSLSGSASPTTTPQVFDTKLSNLTQVVSWKWRDEMDPILCSEKDNRCWLRVDGDLEVPNFGGTLFPIIQNYDDACLTCDGPNKNKKSCNDLDIEYAFFFDKEKPAVPTWFDFNRTDYRHYYLDQSGMSAMVLLNVYYGVDYLNKFFYELPDTHCSRPVEVAKLNGNPLACGTDVSKGAIKKNRKGAKKKYCNTLPVDPQQVFFQCRLTEMDVLQTAIAAAYGSMGSAGALLVLLLMFVATNVVGLKAPTPPDEGWPSKKRVQKFALESDRFSEDQIYGFNPDPEVQRRSTGTGL